LLQILQYVPEELRKFDTTMGMKEKESEQKVAGG